MDMPHPNQYHEYKVIVICESGCSTVLLGAAALPVDLLERRLNEEARAGWTPIFQVIEQRRFLLFWTREAVVVTLAR